jgi:hypothetical protein
MTCPQRCDPWDLNLDGCSLFALKGGQVRFAEPGPAVLDDFHNDPVFS